jgi:hypothetical protein
MVKSLRVDLLVLCNPDIYREYREVIPASRYESRLLSGLKRQNFLLDVTFR